MSQEVQSLVNLCLDVVIDSLIRGDDGDISDLYRLPSDLFDRLLQRSPPLALQRLHEQRPFDSGDDCINSSDSCEIPRKRRRCVNFEKAWENLYKARWPACGGENENTVILSSNKEVKRLKRVDTKHESSSYDWQQMYWETHLQDCMDAAAAIVLSPYFEGLIGETKVLDSILKYIGYRGQHFSGSSGDPSKFSYHCQRFGLYARCLRLTCVHCVSETSHLLRNAKLERLELRWIKTQTEEGLTHVKGLCKLLNQNSGTLKSIKFVYCTFSTSALSEICHSLCPNGLQTHQVQHFCIKTSTLLTDNGALLPDGLLLFLSRGRSLSSLSLSEINLNKNCAKVILKTLLDALSSIDVLDLSENNISGWLSHFKWQYTSNIPSGISNSLKSMRVLNLRDNNLQKGDVDCLRYAQMYMPNLESLDLSGNPIEDGGVRFLVTYLECTQTIVELRLENCELTCNGVKHLLDCLSVLEKPLRYLSIGGNVLGREIGTSIGKFICKGILALDINDIGLGSSGFSKIGEEITNNVKLVYINISNNRGGVKTARFISKLVTYAPWLVAINAGFNFMPAESLEIIGSSLQHANAKLELLDLSGNNSCKNSADASVLAKFEINGRSILDFSSTFEPTVLYDHDP